MSGKTGHMPIRGPEQQNEIAYYIVPGLIDDGHALALNQRLGLLSHLAPADETNGPRLLAQEQFSANELNLLRPLLDQYPDFCPYEVAWASFNSGQVTVEAIARARTRLQEAQFAGVWDYELRPMRNVLSRMRFKLRAFGIDARSILETGYLLKRL